MATSEEEIRRNQILTDRTQESFADFPRLKRKTPEQQAAFMRGAERIAGIIQETVTTYPSYTWPYILDVLTERPNGPLTEFRSEMVGIGFELREVSGTSRRFKEIADALKEGKTIAEIRSGKQKTVKTKTSNERPGRQSHSSRTALGKFI